jgi:hypothetical protein
MAGCVPAPPGAAGATGFDAFGSVQGSGATPGSAASPGSTGSTGSTGPAYWSSVAGTHWTWRADSPFGSGFPLRAVALTGTSPLWLAAARGDDPDLGPTDAGSLAGGGLSGLWRTADGGATWQKLDTTTAQWQGAQTAQIDRVALFGTLPVVAGAVDGRLAVWTGVPTS